MALTRFTRGRLRCNASSATQIGQDNGASYMLSRRAVLLAGTASAILQPGRSLAAVAPPTGLSLGTAGLPTAPLAPGLNISRVVKGCWQLSGGHRGDKATDRTSGRAAIEDFSTFFNAGITTFDAADHYGPAEVLIGKWLQQRSQEAGTDIRSQVQVMTKVCVFDGMSMATTNPGSIAKAVDTSVQRLGTPPDVVQFYWGAYDIPRYTDAAKYLADEQAKGKFGHLGVTNFDVKRMDDITRAGVKLVSNQLQYSLLDRRPENGMADFCQANGIKLLPYGVLAGGFLSDKYLGVPASSVDFDTYSKRKYASVIDLSGGWDWLQQLLQVLKRVADKHESTISNVAARWVLDRPGVAGVILGARNASHVPDHVAMAALRLDDEDRAAIQQVLDRGNKPRGDCYAWERGVGPF